jgi:transcriptional regulator with XRE-family HTH domain
MPATFDSSIVPGLVDMALCSHKTNLCAIAFVRTKRTDIARASPHSHDMARRGIPNEISWYLREWMDVTEAFRGRGGQARMMKETGWSKATMSQLYNGKQDYSPKIIREAATALNIAPYELLMRPETAMAIRRMRQDALRLVADSEALEETQSPDDRPESRDTPAPAHPRRAGGRKR